MRIVHLPVIHLSPEDMPSVSRGHAKETCQRDSTAGKICLVHSQARQQAEDAATAAREAMSTQPALQTSTDAVSAGATDEGMQSDIDSALLASLDAERKQTMKLWSELQTSQVSH